jgi:hypothetical protein
MSFGENESCMDPNILAQQHDTFAAATLKGITLFASAGDDGAAQLNCDGTARAGGVHAGVGSAGLGRRRHRAARSEVLPSPTGCIRLRTRCLGRT